MDVDETPHGAAGGSYTGTKPKRKKVEEKTVVDDDMMNQRLLNSNTFVALERQSQAARGQPTPVVSTAEKSPGKGKQPPLVVKNISFANLFETMQGCDALTAYKITRFGTKINCATVEDFNKVQKHLEQCKLEYYTHDKPNARPFRVVLRGLPLVDPNNIMERLKDHNLVAQEVRIIKRRGECAALDESFYVVHFPKGYTTLKKLSEVNNIGQIIVRWEPYRNKRIDVTQCMNCLYHGHGTRNCHLMSRCNNCGAAHATEKCPTKNAKKCANCGGAHLATDRNCPKRAEYVRIRKQATASNHPGRKAAGKCPAAPAMTMKEFPPLPGSSAPSRASNFVGSQPAVNAGANQRRTVYDFPSLPGSSAPSSASNLVGSQPAINAGANQRRIDPRIRASANAPPPADSSPEANEEVLYSSAELWSIFTEFSNRLKQCNTRSDQVQVLGYMVCKYGVK